MDLDEEEDFGFSFIDESDIVESAILDAEFTKVYEILNMVIPFLEKLKANPKQDTIRWPGTERVKQIDAFINKLRKAAK